MLRRMSERDLAFTKRYGAWAVVAGASEGLGAAFADALGARGVNVVIIARRAALLEDLAARLRASHGVEIRTLACDLADPTFGEALARATGDLEVGVAVYNAAYSFVAPLLDRPLADALRVVDVNVRGPLAFVHALAPAMVARKRGAIVLMSSLAGFQGSPKLATYAASKAFNTILGESLWAELGPLGVDVVTSCAGAIRTPGYEKALKREAPGTLDASAVVAETLGALGHGPLVVPGFTNKLATQVLRRLLPRRSAVRIMGKSGLQPGVERASTAEVKHVLLPLMRFSLAETMCDPSQYVPLAKTAEEVGFHAYTLPDSIAYPEVSDSKYPYTPDGDSAVPRGQAVHRSVLAHPRPGDGHRAPPLRHLRGEAGDPPPGAGGQAGGVGRRPEPG